jgi:hypothetical protein
MIAGVEKTAEPFRKFVPYVLGITAYFTFQILLFAAGLAASVLLGPLFLLLKLIRFAHVSRRMIEVSRVTFKRDPVEAETDVTAVNGGSRADVP